MTLQILPPDFQEITETSVLDSQLVIVLIGLAIGAFAIVKIAKYFSQTKGIKKPNFASFF